VGQSPVPGSALGLGASCRWGQLPSSFGTSPSFDADWHEILSLPLVPSRYFSEHYLRPLLSQLCGSLSTGKFILFCNQLAVIRPPAVEISCADGVRLKNICGKNFVF